MSLDKNYKGIDADLETSLEEYGFVARPVTVDYDDEYFVIYKMDDNQYGSGHIRESELDNIVKGTEWANEEDVNSMLETVGSTRDEWFDLPFTSKFSDLVSYWGTENIMGTDYYPNDKEWAFEEIGLESDNDNDNDNEEEDKDEEEFSRGGEVGMSLLIPYTELISKVKGNIDLSKSREEFAEIMAKIHSDNYTEKDKKYFKTDSGAYHRVRQLIEDVKTDDFNKVVDVFKYLYPLSSNDWKDALFTGLIVKSELKIGNYANGEFVYNDDLAKEIREKGINKKEDILKSIFGSETFAKGGSVGEKYEVELHWKGLDKNRTIGKYVVSEKTLNELEEQWSHIVSVDVYDNTDKKPISWYELKKELYSKGRDIGLYANGGGVEINSISELYDWEEASNYPYARDMVAYFIFGDRDDNLIDKAIRGVYSKETADESRLSEIMLGYEYNWMENMEQLDVDTVEALGDLLDYYANGGEIVTLWKIPVEEGTYKVLTPVLLKKGTKRAIKKFLSENINNKDIYDGRSGVQEWLENTTAEEVKKHNRKSFSNGGGVDDADWIEESLIDLQNETGFDDLIVENSDNNQYTAYNGDAEFEVFETENDARERAIERVKEDLEENPEYFNRDWLMNYIDGKDFFERVFNEWNESYVNDIESEDSDEYANRLIEEMVENGIVSSEEAKEEDFDAEDYKDTFVELLTNNQIDEGNDGLNHYINNFGEEQAFKVVSENNLIDIEKASESAIDTDGIAHFLSSYDGEQIDLSNGHVAYRTN